MNIDKSAYLKLQAQVWRPQAAGDEQQQPSRDKLEQACAEFAAIFWQAIIKSMHSTIPKSSFCPEVQGKKLLNSVVDQKMAQFMASKDGAGLKKLLLREFQNRDSSK